ncbi:MAG: ABC transporter permease [Acidobacteria bacterium]|nr:ABC transporter permease [Acidobacteriota bacterium]
MTGFYRLVLWLLPGDLRRDFGPEMLQTVALLSRDPRYQTIGGRLRLLAALTRDGLISAWRTRGADARGGRPLPPSQQPPFPGKATLMDFVWLDLRAALRTLRKNAGFTALAVLTLGLGIGANVAVFGVLNAVLLRPLPYDDPDQLVVLAETFRGNSANASYPNVADWQERADLFEGITGFDDRKVFNLTGGDMPQQVYGASATAGFFDVLGVAPLRGRTFRPDDDVPEAAKVVVLSERLWRDAFGADEQIVGRDLRMNGEPYTVIGVVPASLRIPNREDLWVPLATHPYGDDRLQVRSETILEVIGRLKPGVTLAQGRDQISAIAAALAANHPGELDGRGATAWPLRDDVVGNIEPVLDLMLAAVGIVLLIAVVNVTNMSLARAVTRRREVSLRMALGAGPWRLARGQLIESGVLAVSGGVLGATFASWIVPWVLAMNPDALPTGITVELAPDAAMLAFVAGLVTLSTLGAGLVPVMLTRSRRLTGPLQDGSGAASGGAFATRVRNGLVVVEVALSLVLLAGAALLVQSLTRAARIEPGFATEGLLTARIDLPVTEYDADAQRRFFDQLRERLGGLPRIQSVGLVSRLPLSGATSISAFDVDGMGEVPADERPAAHIRTVGPGYFEALSIPLVRGRTFDENDGVSTFGVIVDEELAEQLWPGEEAIGKQIRESAATPWVPVVGVVGRTRHWGQLFAPTQTLYLPYKMLPEASMHVVLRTEGEPATLTPTLREIVREIDPALPVNDVQSMEERVAGSLARPRFNTALLSVFAAVAVALGALGIYGTIAWSVAQRRREIGVRLALGARQGDVRRMVVAQGLRLTLLGVALGVPAALAAARLIESQLFQIEPTDPATLAAVATAIGAVALAASWLSARQATRVDPLTSLRTE